MEASRALTCVCLLAGVQRASKGNCRVGHAHEGSNEGHEGERVEVGELQHSKSQVGEGIQWGGKAVAAPTVQAAGTAMEPWSSQEQAAHKRTSSCNWLCWAGGCGAAVSGEAVLTWIRMRWHEANTTIQAERPCRSPGHTSQLKTAHVAELQGKRHRCFQAGCACLANRT